MKRILPLLLGLPLLVFAFVLGAANADPVVVDLLFISVAWPLGVVLVVTLGAGMVLAGVLLYFLQILPMSLQLRNYRRKFRQASDSHEMQQG